MATLVLCCALLRPAPVALASWQSFTTADGLAYDGVGDMLEDRNGVFWFTTTGRGISRYDGVTWRNFTTGDGVDALVYSAMEDRAGNLWFGTAYGVNRFDGATWQRFWPIDGLAGAPVRAMFEDRDGNMWFGCDEGLSRYDGSTWTTFTVADGLAGNAIRQIVQDRAGFIWVGTTTGLCGYDGSTWRTFSVVNTSVGGLLEDRAGNLWVGMVGVGVNRFDGATWRLYSTSDGLVSAYMSEIVEDRAGDVWLRTSSGVSRFHGSAWESYTTAEGLVDNNVQVIIEDRAGTIWFGTRSGVSRFDGATWRSYTTDDGLVGNSISRIVQDRSGNLWFVAYGHGVSRFDGAAWQTFDVTTVPGLRNVADVHLDRKGTLWCGTRGGGIGRYDGSTWSTFSTSSGLPDSVFAAILEDRGGNLWFGTYHGGAIRYDGATWQIFTTADGLADDNVEFLFEDSVGKIWFGSRGGGVSTYDGVGWKTYTMADGLAGDTVLGIEEDHAGAMWFATDGGVSRYDGSTWQTFTIADGLASDNVLSVLEDRIGVLWFGTAGAGVTRYDGATWRTFNVLDGLTNNVVFRVVENHAGVLWFATAGGGVSRFDGATWTTIDVSDGLADNYVYDLVEDAASGVLWFATYGGVSRLEPDQVPARTVLLTAPPALSASRNHAAAFTAAFGEKNVQFSTRLDQGAWSAWSTDPGWLGTGLSDGTHLLEIRSTDDWGNVEAIPASARFEVDATPPLPRLSAPAFGAAIRGTTAILGSADDARFAAFQVWWRPAGASSWEPPDATQLTESSTPVADGSLATWDTSQIPDGIYEILVSVSDSLGLTGGVQISVIVDNQAPFVDVTSPAKVPAASGGDVFSMHGELHVYFPPHAFKEDALVTIAPAASAPDTLPSRAVRAQPAYEISWGAAKLQKPFTLEYSTAGLADVPGPLAIYVRSNGGDWAILGGSREVGRVSLAASAAGVFGLYSEGYLAEGLATLSALTFTPRVFSISDRYANDHVAIGFNLGRSAPVHVRVYNRAGRLVREIASGQVMGSGGNLLRWYGRDRAEVPVPDGIYIVTVEALGQTRRSTIAVVR